MCKTTKKYRRIAFLLTLALLITSFAGIGNVNKAQAAVTQSGIIYDGNGEITKTLLNGKSAKVTLNGSIIDIRVDGEKYGYYGTICVGTCVIAEDDLLHIFWHTGEYYVYDLYESGRYILAGYTGVKGYQVNYYAVSSTEDANIVKGSSAANASFHSCIIDSKYFYMYGKTGKKLLMTRKEFNRIVDGDDSEPTAVPSQMPVPTATSSNNCGCKDGKQCTCPAGQCKCNNCNCGPTSSCQPTATPAQSPSNNGGCKGNCGCGCGSNCNGTCCGGNCNCNGNGSNSGGINVVVPGDGNNVNINIDINENNTTVIGDGNNVNPTIGGNAGVPYNGVFTSSTGSALTVKNNVLTMYPTETQKISYFAYDANGNSVKGAIVNPSKKLTVKVVSENLISIKLKKSAKDSSKYSFYVKNGSLKQKVTVVCYRPRVITSGKRIKLFEKQNKLYGWLLYNKHKGTVKWNGLATKKVLKNSNGAAGFIQNSWNVTWIGRDHKVYMASYHEGTVKVIGNNAKCYRRDSHGFITSYVKRNNKKVVKISGN